VLMWLGMAWIVVSVPGALVLGAVIAARTRADDLRALPRNDLWWELHPAVTLVPTPQLAVAAASPVAGCRCGREIAARGRGRQRCARGRPAPGLRRG